MLGGRVLWRAGPGGAVEFPEDRWEERTIERLNPALHQSDAGTGAQAGDS